MWIRVLRTALMSGFCLICSAPLSAQSTTLASGQFVGMTPGEVRIQEGGGLKVVPLRVTVIVSIRGPFEIEQLAKGMKVAVHGRIEDGSQTVRDWSLTVYPLSTPQGIHSIRYEPTADKKGFWELDAYCEVMNTSPLTVRILPGNEFAAAVFDATTNAYWYAPYKGPRPIGLTIPLQEDERRGTPMIEFGPNPQYAGAGATASVTGGGIPPMGEQVRIVRTEPFKIDVKSLKTTKKR